MSNNLETESEKRGRDTSYRASNLDTHLTHGCIPLFRHSWSKRIAFALHVMAQIDRFSPLFEQAIRIRNGGAL